MHLTTDRHHRLAASHIAADGQTISSTFSSILEQKINANATALKMKFSGLFTA